MWGVQGYSWASATLMLMILISLCGIAGAPRPTLVPMAIPTRGLLQDDQDDSPALEDLVSPPDSVFPVSVEVRHSSFVGTLGNHFSVLYQLCGGTQGLSLNDVNASS